MATALDIGETGLAGREAEETQQENEREQEQEQEEDNDDWDENWEIYYTEDGEEQVTPGETFGSPLIKRKGSKVLVTSKGQRSTFFFTY